MSSEITVLEMSGIRSVFSGRRVFKIGSLVEIVFSYLIF